MPPKHIHTDWAPMFLAPGQLPPRPFTHPRDQPMPIAHHPHPSQPASNPHIPAGHPQYMSPEQLFMQREQLLRQRELNLAHHVQVQEAAFADLAAREANLQIDEQRVKADADSIAPKMNSMSKREAAVKRSEKRLEDQKRAQATREADLNAYADALCARESEIERMEQGVRESVDWLLAADEELRSWNADAQAVRNTANTLRTDNVALSNQLSTLRKDLVILRNVQAENMALQDELARLKHMEAKNTALKHANAEHRRKEAELRLRLIRRNRRQAVCRTCATCEELEKQAVLDVDDGTCGAFSSQCSRERMNDLPLDADEIQDQAEMARQHSSFDDSRGSSHSSTQSFPVDGDGIEDQGEMSRQDSGFVDGDGWMYSYAHESVEDWVNDADPLMSRRGRKERPCDTLVANGPAVREQRRAHRDAHDAVETLDWIDGGATSVWRQTVMPPLRSRSEPAYRDSRRGRGEWGECDERPQD